MNTYAVILKRIEFKSQENQNFKSVDICITFHLNNTTFKIVGNERHKILKIKNYIEEDLNAFAIPIIPYEPEESITPVVFIGHGGSNDWRDLKDHLTDQHGIKVVAYETGTRAGHTIRDVLDEMLTTSSFAILVMTAADEQADGTMNARPNVIHEVGLFQGKLGFNKAIVALEKGTNLFSNLDGVQQLRFSTGNIKEIYGDVLATLKREFNK